MEPTSLPTIGALLRRYRTAAALTQEALAARSGVSVYSISNLERDVGHTPRKDTLSLLADSLGLPHDQRAMLQAAAGQLHTSHATAANAPGAAATAAMRKSLPYHVPIPPTPLIGREHELAALGALLRARAIDDDPAATPATPRLLTLVGPPGVGKTRLALEVVRAHTSAFRDGIAWVPLAPLRDAHLVAATIAQTLDLRQRGAEPVEALLQRHLQDKDLLLLLDNFEHLLPAAPFVAGLLAICPAVRIFITSRAPLHLRAEQEFPLAPLPTPTPTPTLWPSSDTPHRAYPPSLETLAQIPAVALFVTRAQAVLPTFALTPANAPAVAAICRRLDGLPLAIELAATRLTVLSPTALLTLLEHRLPVLTGGPHDLPIHQQTLRGTLAWSYDLLTADEQTLFRRLAVFSGGAPLAAVSPVCCGANVQVEGSQEAEPAVLTSLSALLDHHLLMRLDATEPTDETPAEPRYGMLETIREYAWDQLRKHDEAAAVERAHALYYLALVEAEEPKLRGPEQAEWLVRLETEHDNLRAALRWSLAHRTLLPALRSTLALSRFWLTRGYLSEGRAWLDQMLALVDEDGARESIERPDESFRVAVARALNAAGALAYLQSDFARATELYDKSLALRRLIGDRSRIAAALNNLAAIAHLRGEVERAAELWSECLDLLGENGDQSGFAYVLGNLGRLARDKGNYAQATQLLEDSLERRRALGDKQLTAEALIELGDLARRRADVMRAWQLIEEGLTITRGLGDQQGTGLALVYLGRVACELGSLAHAAALFEESLRLYRTLSDQRSSILCIEGIACVAAAEQRPEAAVRLLGTASALRQALGTPLPPADGAVHDRLLAETRARLREASFKAAWEAGEQLSFEQVLVEALTAQTALPASAAAESVPARPTPPLA